MSPKATKRLPIQEEPDPTTVTQAQPELKPGASVYDGDGAWSKETRIEIFHAVYDNETGQVTVLTGNGDKLIAPAPGTNTISARKTRGIPP